MNNWKSLHISDLGRIITGKTPKTSIKENYGGNIPFLTPSDDLSNKYAPDTNKKITELGLNEVKNCLLPPNSICVSCIGSDLGKVVMLKEYSVTNQQFNSIIPYEDFYPDFIYYLMTIVGKELNFIGKTSTAVPIINKSTFSKTEVVIPSLPTQQKIANILSSLDDKIEVNRRINEQLEELAQALFKSWFVDFEPFKDGEFVESELGMIPKGWKVTKLDEVCSYISRGLTPKYDNDSDEIILGQTCVRNNIVTLNNGRKHRPKKKNEKWIQQWDVLINSTGVGSLGRVGVVYFDKDNVAIDSHITVVRPISSLYKHYIGRTLLSKQAEIENMAIGSTGQTELPKDSIKSMLILLPIDDILVLFNKSIEPICKLMYSNLEEITHLSNLRDTLLPKLMSGEIDINEVEI